MAAGMDEAGEGCLANLPGSGNEIDAEGFDRPSKYRLDASPLQRYRRNITIQS